ncbi:hypothetical protein CLOM_g15848 [Closterium sp. NIES-68]|nr:hypothetical protein CLOM_g15848 [Closterium sp. NIES-68]GJP64804.1 hypothetical protein CLOP_g21750 [Closterium sp. NIES-67]
MEARAEDAAMEEAEEAEEQGEWEEWQEDDEEAADPALCFFCPRQLSDVAAMLQHCRAEHGGFDFRQQRAAQRWDEYQCIRAINFIRTQVAAHRCIHCLDSFPSPADLIQHMEASQHFRLPPLPPSSSPSPSAPPPWGDDAYLRSFLEDDPVLYSFDDDGGSDEATSEGAADGAAAAVAAPDAAVVDVTGLPLTAASAGAAAAAAAAGGGGEGGSEEERAMAFQELLSLVHADGAAGGEGEGAEASGSGGVGVQGARTGGLAGEGLSAGGAARGGEGSSAGRPSGGCDGKGKAKADHAAAAGGEVEGDGEEVMPSLEQYMALANQVLLLRQQNAQLAHQLAATSAGVGAAAAAAGAGGIAARVAGRAADGSFAFTPADAAAAAATSVPPTPFSTPMVSPSPSSASLVATAAAAAAIATAASAAAHATGSSHATDAPSADAAAGTAAAAAAAVPAPGQGASVPRTPFSTPLVSPCPSYASLATAAAAAAAAAGVEGSGRADGMHEGSVKDMLLQATHQQQHKQGRPPIPVSPRPAVAGPAAADKAGGAAPARVGPAGAEGTGGPVVEGGSSGAGSPMLPRTPFSTPLASPSPSYALLPLDEAQKKLAAVAEAADGADGDADASALSAAAGRGEGGGSGGQAARKRRQVTFGMVQERQMRVIDASYFSSYAGFGIHREMLGDKARTTAYQAALEENPSLIEGATVLDVGCGTGILSLFAARGGAARVVAVDGSREILAVAQQIAGDNGYLAEPHAIAPPPSSAAAHLPQRAPRPVVSFVCGKIEELRPLGAQGEAAQGGSESGRGAGVAAGAGLVPLERGSVDVIVSEWMGYALLYESMLPSVLHARDTWLKPGGALLPDTASMHVAGFGEGATSVPFWRDVYGFSMAAVAREIEDEAARTPLVQAISGCDVVTSTCPIQHFDLCTVTADDLDFTSDFHLTPALPASTDQSTSGDPSAAAPASSPSPSPLLCYGLALWFDTAFSARFCTAKPVLLSTSPVCPPTHWAQTLLTFREPIGLAPAAAQGGETMMPGAAAPSAGAVGSAGRPAVEVRGRVSVVRATKHRSIDISLEVMAVSADGGKKTWPAQMFTI